jgi:transcriptional regulator with XRE-family HTH domain
MFIANKIKSLRQQLGLTQKQMAVQFKLSPSTVYLYESGKRMPGADLLMNMENALKNTGSQTEVDPTPTIGTTEMEYTISAQKRTIELLEEKVQLKELELNRLKSLLDDNTTNIHDKLYASLRTNTMSKASKHECHNCLETLFQSIGIKPGKG